MLYDVRIEVLAINALHKQTFLSRQLTIKDSNVKYFRKAPRKTVVYENVHILADAEFFFVGDANWVTFRVNDPKIQIFFPK